MIVVVVLVEAVTHYKGTNAGLQKKENEIKCRNLVLEIGDRAIVSPRAHRGSCSCRSRGRWSSGSHAPPRSCSPPPPRWRKHTRWGRNMNKKYKSHFAASVKRQLRTYTHYYDVQLFIVMISIWGSSQVPRPTLYIFKSVLEADFKKGGADL